MNKLWAILSGVAVSLALNVAPVSWAESVRQITSQRVMNTLTTENNLIANFIELLNKEECYITSKPQKNQEEYIHAIRTLRKFANVDIGSEKAAKRKRVFQPGDTPISYEQAQENLEKARKNAGMSYAIVLGNMAEFFKKNPNACKRVEA